MKIYIDNIPQENFSLVQEKQMGTTHQGGRDVPDIFSDIPDINMLLKVSLSFEQGGL